MKKGFTLAEVMITLTVIGIITAVILPVAFHSKPDENVMKFKKAHNTLYQVIRVLINNEKYYTDGDLGLKPDGSPVQEATYFCRTFSDVISAKKVNCYNTNFSSEYYEWLDIVTAGNISNLKKFADASCKHFAPKYKEQIVAQDGINYFETGPGVPFGILGKDGANFTIEEDASLNADRLFDITAGNNGFLRIYKTFCIDIDGVPGGATKDDCVNECPFGYAIRVDGRILSGQRADEWLNKSLQNE